MAGDCTTVPEGYDPYKVDLGGHWELKSTERSKAYGVKEGTGNDLVANKLVLTAVLMTMTTKLHTSGKAHGFILVP